MENLGWGQTIFSPVLQDMRLRSAFSSRKVKYGCIRMPRHIRVSTLWQRCGFSFPTAGIARSDLTLFVWHESPGVLTIIRSTVDQNLPGISRPKSVSPPPCVTGLCCRVGVSYCQQLAAEVSSAPVLLGFVWRKYVFDEHAVQTNVQVLHCLTDCLANEVKQEGSVPDDELRWCVAIRSL